ncbi:hypothetical protein, partial [Achromobacter insuavis]|uniref:hypothetical protein n=1 Tax=Achromobacter insuavis TaxID=1287735 RepID=UPI001967D772
NLRSRSARQILSNRIELELLVVLRHAKTPKGWIYVQLSGGSSFKGPFFMSSAWSRRACPGGRGMPMTNGCEEGWPRRARGGGLAASPVQAGRISMSETNDFMEIKSLLFIQGPA